MYVHGTDDVDLSDELSGRSWEQQRQKIKAVEDKYRWKLNERGVTFSFYYLIISDDEVYALIL